MTVAEAVQRKVRKLPFLIEPENIGSNSVAALMKQIIDERDRHHDLLRQHGGLLFRGFTLQTAADFSNVARTLIPELMPYVEGQSPRTRVGDNVYTSTEFPAGYQITLHHELSYAKRPPPRIVFHCQVAPTTGGETPIVDCRQVYQQMPEDLRVKFESHGVRYMKSMHGAARGLGKSWMQHFETDDPNQVEDYLTENDITFEWTAAGHLRTWADRPATLPHPVTGEWVWFNQANLWHVTNVEPRHRAQIIKRCGPNDLPTHACFGDGSPISDEDMDRVREVLWRNAVSNPWEPGDVLLLDNFLVAHGRNPFTGPRRIHVVMG